MTANFRQATDEINRQFEDAWNAGAGAVNPGGTVPPVQYEGLPVDDTTFPPEEGQWARVTIRHASAAQAAFGVDGIDRFRKNGAVFVQVFAALTNDDPKGLAGDLAQIVKDAYEGQTTEPGRVEFRNVTMLELGVDAAWYNVNINAEFEYDELT